LIEDQEERLIKSQFLFVQKDVKIGDFEVSQSYVNARERKLDESMEVQQPKRSQKRNQLMKKSDENPPNRPKLMTRETKEKPTNREKW